MTNLFRQVASNERMAWRRLLLDLKIMVSIKWRGNCIPSAIAMFSKIVASCEVKSLWEAWYVRYVLKTQETRKEPLGLMAMKGGEWCKVASQVEA